MVDLGHVRLGYDIQQIFVFGYVKSTRDCQSTASKRTNLLCIGLAVSIQLVCLDTFELVRGRAACVRVCRQLYVFISMTGGNSVGVSVVSVFDVCL
jgi:hypothetical protein